jgi:hypothetical protein
MAESDTAITESGNTKNLAKVVPEQPESECATFARYHYIEAGILFPPVYFVAIPA